jgi:hypothetical protein
MDIYGWFIATLHQMHGHDKLAAFIGQPPGDKAACLLCQYEREPTQSRRQAVVAAIGSSRTEEE